MSKIYRAAIIGCGAIAGGYDEKSGFRYVFTHAGAYKKHPRFELKAIAEDKKERLSEFQKTWQIQTTYTDYRELLKQEQIDLLSVCVPDYLHFSVVNAALEHSRVKCILVEKPIATTVNEATQMLEFCKKKGVSLYVNYNRLWDPIHHTVKRLMSEGFLGTTQGCVAYYVRGIKHNGTTMFSTLRFLLGEDINHVQAIRVMDSDVNNDFAIDGLLTLNNGVRVFLIASDKMGYGHSIFEIDLMGNKGRIRLIDNGYKVEVYELGKYKRYLGAQELIPFSPKKQKQLPKSKMSRTLLSTLDEIASSLDQGILNLDYAKEATKDLRIAEALIESINRNGIQIKI